MAQGTKRMRSPPALHSVTSAAPPIYLHISFLLFLSLAILSTASFHVTFAFSVPVTSHDHGNWNSRNGSRLLQSSSSLMESRSRGYKVKSYTIAGTDPDRPQKVNQDAHVSHRLTIPPTSSQTSQERKFTVAGVMDGHGLKGHVLTHYLKDQLVHRLEQRLTLIDEKNDSDNEDEKVLAEMEEKLRSLGHASSDDFYTNNENSNKNKTIARCLVESFHLSHHDACQNTSVPAGRSGCACILALFTEIVNENETLLPSSNLHIAHVGDCRAILVAIGNKKSHRSTFAYTHDLSWETRTTVQTERERIEKGEGRVDAAGNVFYGPVGIAMTRALGDAVMLRAGVLPTPIVQSFRLGELQKLVWNGLCEDENMNENENDEGMDDVDTRMFIVMGTDGIFDVMTNRDVADVIRELFHSDPQQPSSFENYQDNGNDGEEGIDVEAAIALAISKRARSLWMGDLPVEVKADDVTCCVVSLP